MRTLGKPSLNTSSIRAPSLEDKIKIAYKAGFTAVEVYNGDLNSYLDQGGDLQRIAATLKECSLAVCSVMGFRGWVTPERVTEEQLLEQNRRLLDACRTLNSPIVHTTTTGKQYPNLDRLAENFKLACIVARKSGLDLALEFIATQDWRPMKTLGEALKFLEMVSLPNAKVLIDTFHFYAGGSRIDDLRRAPVEKVGIVHFEDVPEAFDSAVPHYYNRALPGEGVAPLREIVQILQEKGYDGYYSIELFGEAYWSKDPLEVARKCYIAIQKSLGREVKVK